MVDIDGAVEGEVVGYAAVGKIDGELVGSEVIGEVDGDVVGSEVVGDVVGPEVVGEIDGDVVRWGLRYSSRRKVGVNITVVGEVDDELVGSELVGSELVGEAEEGVRAGWRDCSARFRVGVESGAPYLSRSVAMLPITDEVLEQQFPPMFSWPVRWLTVPSCPECIPL